LKGVYKEKLFFTTGVAVTTWSKLRTTVWRTSAPRSVLLARALVVANNNVARFACVDGSLGIRARRGKHDVAVGNVDGRHTH